MRGIDMTHPSPIYVDWSVINAFEKIKWKYISHISCPQIYHKYTKKKKTLPLQFYQKVSNAVTSSIIARDKWKFCKESKTLYLKNRKIPLSNLS